MNDFSFLYEKKQKKEKEFEYEYLYLEEPIYPDRKTKEVEDQSIVVVDLLDDCNDIEI